MKKSILGLLLSSVALMALLGSCDKKETLYIDMGYEYYPAKVGYWMLYDVDSIYFSDLSYPVILSDTIHFQIKELLDTVYLDNEGRTTYRIERYRRTAEGYPWSIDRVWSLNKTNTMVTKNEDDLHFIKLVFPMGLGTTWNGNSMIVTTGGNAYLQDWEYNITEYGKPYSLGSLSFDSTLVVVQKDEENLIEKKSSYERYARNVGMISKELKWLGKQHDLTNGWDHPETGILVRYTLTDYQR